MNKPQKQDYGWNEETGWTQGDKARFEYDTETWKIVNRKPGRQRTRPIHPSWNTVLQHFNPSDPTRSQGAFCRAMGLKRAAFSAMQCKQMPLYIQIDVARWVEELTEVGKIKEVENG